jgi:hypothetical protein
MKVNIILHEQTILKLDLDNKLIDYWKEEWLKTRKAILEALNLKLEKVIIKESPSKKGYHVWLYVKGKPMNDLEVLRCQSLLGDCPTRCKINYIRITQRNITKWWNKLFAKHLRRFPDPKCKECRIVQILKEMEEETFGSKTHPSHV